MKLSIPIVGNPVMTLKRWAAEINAQNFLTGTDLTWKDYEPEFSASGSMTFTRTSSLRAKYLELGAETILISVLAVGTTGGTPSTTIYFSLPFPCTEQPDGSGDFFPFACWVRDNGSSIAGRANTGDSGRIGVLRYDSANWAAAPTTGQTFAVNGFYIRG